MKEKANILERLREGRLFFDGGTGTVLQELGMAPGIPPEQMNVTDPDCVKRLHVAYLNAGADIIKTNTFGINPLKYIDYDGRLRQAVGIAMSAVDEMGGRGLVALDLGPTGRMLKPLGDLDFEDAVAAYGKCAKVGAECGCDLVLIETMSDLYEVKAAVLGVKENCSLPVFVTCAFGADGKLTTGGSAAAVVAMLEGLRVDAIGVNCSQGPRELATVVEEFCRLSSLPVIVNPNAGLPRITENGAVYDLSPSEFGLCMKKMAQLGAAVLGGCCGTTPDYIATTVAAVKDIPYTPPVRKDFCVVCSHSREAFIGNTPLVVGERINPTGKPKLKTALREGDVSYILTEAISEEDEGAHILDVNMGLADIDEAAWLPRAVAQIQAVCPLPLQLDTGNVAALEAALRIYCGKPVINSVNGSEESLSSVLPLVKKYGGALIALTMDEDGIPSTAQGRVAIAERIAARAENMGISKRDLIFDPLTLTVASSSDNARVTLDTLRELHRRGYRCALGVSNVSFGLPEREAIGSAFLSAALWEGLDLAIINPRSAYMMNAYYSYLALSGKDTGCAEYVSSVRAMTGEGIVVKKEKTAQCCNDLGQAIERGLVERAEDECLRLLDSCEPAAIISEHIIPALDRVGDAFAQKRIFLPGLMMSAEAASRAFLKIKERAPRVKENGKKVVLATVKGDIHDIGKNIVKLMLESYGYTVIDLGRDVSAERVLDALRESGAEFLGLSALMTTTLPAMSKTVALVKQELPRVKIMVGGAVLTGTYAASIGALYAPDAPSAVRLIDK